MVKKNLLLEKISWNSVINIELFMTTSYWYQTNNLVYELIINPEEIFSDP